MNMDNAEKILIIVDPTQEEHVALDRAVTTSRLREHPPEIHVFLGVDGDSNDTRATNANMFRDNQWFEALMQPMVEAGTTFQAHISWSSQWQESILAKADEIGADLIVVPDYSIKANAARFKDTHWALMRKAKCPVLVVRPQAHPLRKSVVAAINAQAKDGRYQALNEKVLKRGQWMAGRYGADFHVVSAYPDSMNYPDRGQLLRQTGLEADQLHLKQGSPEDVIAEMAQELKADVVVIGTMARDGVLAAMRGNTSEKVISKLSMDVMTLN